MGDGLSSMRKAGIPLALSNLLTVLPAKILYCHCGVPSSVGSSSSSSMILTDDSIDLCII